MKAALDRLVDRLLAERTAAGHWEGELSASALSTATAVITLQLAREQETLVAGGLDWLRRTQNADGGWGDTVLSCSNISTTALVWAAFTIAGDEGQDRCEAWLREAAGGTLEPTQLASAISARYGKDQTFSVPILTVLAIAGHVPWSVVPQLPFELAAFPRSWYRGLGLPVVSYALPALIAIGHVHHRRRPVWNPVTRGLRTLLSDTTLGVLGEIQPSNGGFLEAVPLTSFVCLSLLAAGYSRGPVLNRGLEFLRQSVRPDGSWPIDTNLATWTTTLAVNALGDRLPPDAREPIRDWLLGQQYRETHPYTGAPPGAWAWTDLPGGVPDADDTSGALLALHGLDQQASGEAACAGVRWLLDLQNHDGGVPTFCRGWGKLPFDRSSQDITAHALQAWSRWRPLLALKADRERTATAISKALVFLEQTQRADGAWVPLWFGNQAASNDENPVYGTARVLLALERLAPQSKMALRAVEWLESAQNEDRGWGGDKGIPSTLDETSLAVAALASWRGDVSRQGAAWIVEATDDGRSMPPAQPIGFYFARLWYFEKLYPLIFAVDALRRTVDATP